MKSRSNRSIFILLFTLIFVISSTVAAFATQTITYTTNGAAGNYVAGSVLVLYGKVTDGGKAVPNTKVTVDIQDTSAMVIYYGQLKTDSSGYFKTNFTIPSGVSGAMSVNISTLAGATVSASYSLNVSGSVAFQGTLPQGYLEGGTVTTIPASTSKLGLVFSANVNYFNNRNNNLDLDSLGINDRNEDCVKLYEKNSAGTYDLISSSLDMVSSDTAGNAIVSNISYLSGIADSDKKNERKDVLYVVPKNSLESGTTYKVVIDGDLCANSSATLGSDVTVFFTTAASSSGGSDSGTVAASSVEKVAASAVGSVTTGEGSSSLAVDSAKAGAILADADKTALAIDLSDLTGQDNDQVNVTLPAKILALAKTENKPIILNYGSYVMVVPPGSLPVEKQITLTAKNAGIPSADANRPQNITGMEKFELSAKDSNGNDVSFNSSLNMEFDIPENTINSDRLCIYFVDDATGAWVYAGGRILNGKLTFSPEHYSTYVIAESTKTFTDISSSWAKNYIEAMVARQISKGVSDSLFAPNQSVTRAEFAVLLSRVLGLDSSDKTNTFTDVVDTAWYQKEVSQVAALGIVTGDNGKFRPSDKISRQEMAVMLSRAAAYAGTKASNLKAITYSDKGNIAAWAYDGVSQISNMGIMSGYPDGNFGGSQNSTRAEATKTLKAFMDELEL